jgi:hypothetical protein
MTAIPVSSAFVGSSISVWSLNESVIVELNKRNKVTGTVGVVADCS